MFVKRLATFVFALALIAPLASAVLAAPAPAAPKVQLVKLTVDDKGYVATPSTVVKGVPVRMEVDLATVKGCNRTVVINAFNVKQTVKDGATTIEFTPGKTGKIEIVCGMNMTKGTFTVNEPK